MLEIIIGTKKGDMRPTPSFNSTSVWLTKVWMPPMPEPMYTPRRSGAMFSPLARPLSFMACAAAAMAYWQ